MRATSRRNSAWRKFEPARLRLRYGNRQAQRRPLFAAEASKPAPARRTRKAAKSKPPTKEPEKPIDLSASKPLDMNGKLQVGELQVNNIKAPMCAWALRAKEGRMDVESAGGPAVSGHHGGCDEHQCQHQPVCSEAKADGYRRSARCCATPPTRTSSTERAMSRSM